MVSSKFGESCKLSVYIGIHLGVKIEDESRPKSPDDAGCAAESIANPLHIDGVVAAPFGYGAFSL